MPHNYNPDLPDFPIERKGLRRIAKALRDIASGPLPEIEDEEKKKQYKHLLFSSSRNLDEAAKILPRDSAISFSYPWWIWLMFGMMAITSFFFVYVAWMRFVLGYRIGFLP